MFRKTIRPLYCLLARLNCRAVSPQGDRPWPQVCMSLRSVCQGQHSAVLLTVVYIIVCVTNSVDKWRIQIMIVGSVGGQAALVCCGVRTLSLRIELQVQIQCWKFSSVMFTLYWTDCPPYFVWIRSRTDQWSMGEKINESTPFKKTKEVIMLNTLIFPRSFSYNFKKNKNKCL